ncbi:MAG TPA: type II secretion system F family protein [Noviherbaspirillum sp.]|nr:type II secretion system F family protein [Noviherbaspirillum sp.]
MFSWPVREALYRHLSAQIFNGIAVEAALDNFRSRLKRRKKVTADKIVGDVARRMRDGATLADALSAWLPNEELGVISSGELAGNIPRALDLLIESKRRISRVNAALKSAMTTPAIYTLAVYGMLWAIGKYVTPGFAQALSREKARGLVYGLYVAGDLANSWWMLAPLITFGGIIAGVAWSLSRWTGALRIKAEGIFPYSFYRDIQGYTWLMSFTALLRSGVADVEILKRQVKTATPWLKERLHAIWWRMDNGASLPKALLAKGKNNMPAFGFPNPDIVDDITSMAGFADFPDRIATLAMQWADELETKTLARAKAFGFFMEIFMYMLMGVLMLAINSMSTQVGSVPGM